MHITQRLLLQALPDPVYDRGAPDLGLAFPDTTSSLARRVRTLAVSSGEAINRLRNRNRLVRSADESNDSPVHFRLREVRRARQEFDDAEGMVVLEYVPNGNLGSFLERLDRENAEGSALPTRPPEKILWSIFHCLLQGCLAMAFPGERMRQTGIDPSKTQIPSKAEVFPDYFEKWSFTRRRVIRSQTLVHFALDLSKGKRMIMRAGGHFETSNGGLNMDNVPI